MLYMLLTNHAAIANVSLKASQFLAVKRHAKVQGITFDQYLNKLLQTNNTIYLDSKSKWAESLDT